MTTIKYAAVDFLKGLPMYIKIAAACIFLPWALYYEYQWLVKRWSWRWRKGRIIGRPESVSIDQSLTDYFLVEVEEGGETRQATAYDHRLVKDSSKDVDCVVSPAGIVEIYSIPQRSLGTLIPLAIFVLILL